MMTFSMKPDTISDLPEVDDRLVTPETRFEVEDGRWVTVAPADEPHGEHHSCVDGLLRGHRARDYSVAVDLLTRTSPTDDLAPDVSVYPTARDPRTGGRQREELAFEIVSIVSKETLAHAGGKAAKLVSRGVRRVFALDLERKRVLEWSRGQWSLLARTARIEDPALEVPIPIEALLDAALADDAIVRAWRQKRHPEFLAERAAGEAAGRARGEAEGRARGEAEGRARGEAEGRARGRAEALLIVLASRGLEPTELERHRIYEERDLDRLERWLAAAPACADIAALLAT